MCDKDLGEVCLFLLTIAMNTSQCLCLASYLKVSGFLNSQRATRILRARIPPWVAIKLVKLKRSISQENIH